MKQEIIDFLTQPWYIYFRDAFESDTAGVVFVVILLGLGLVGLWLWWDSYDFFDMVGAIALLMALNRKEIETEPEEFAEGRLITL